MQGPKNDVMASLPIGRQGGSATSTSVTVKIAELPFISDDVLFLSLQIATLSAWRSQAGIFPITFFTRRKFRNDGWLWSWIVSRKGSVKISVTHFKNIHIKLFYLNNANNQESDIFKKCTP